MKWAISKIHERGNRRILYVRKKSFPVFAITAITKISNRLNVCKLQR